MKEIIALLIMISASAHAIDKIICLNRGNIQGSYSLDITGYEKVLDGTVKSFTKTLNFKWFRSYEEPVSDVICKAPNSYIDGPNALLVCRTEIYGPNAMVALIYEYQAKLFMSVRGQNQPLIDGISCQRSSF